MVSAAFRLFGWFPDDPRWGEGNPGSGMVARSESNSSSEIMRSSSLPLFRLFVSTTILVFVRRESRKRGKEKEEEKQTSLFGKSQFGHFGAFHQVGYGGKSPIYPVVLSRQSQSSNKCWISKKNLQIVFEHFKWSNDHHSIQIIVWRFRSSAVPFWQGSRSGASNRATRNTSVGFGTRIMSRRTCSSLPLALSPVQDYASRALWPGTLRLTSYKEVKESPRLIRSSWFC